MSTSGETNVPGGTTGTSDTKSASSTDTTGTAGTERAGAKSDTKTGGSPRTPEDRDRAERRQAAGAAGAGGAAADLSRATKEMSDRAMSRGAALREERKMLLQNKMDMEKERRALNAEVVLLVEQIAASDNQAVIAKSTLAALETATVALADIVVSLDQAATFWTKIEQACDNLNNSDLRDDIKRASRETDTARRIAKYDNSYIKEDAIRYLSSWRALQLLCESYKKASTEAWRESGNRIKQSPGIEESKALLPQLKANVLNSLKREQDESKEREAAYGKSIADNDAMVLEATR